MRCSRAAAEREPSELQPGESRAAASSTPGPRGRPCRAGSRGACRAHEAGLARSPRAVIGPAERPAPPPPRPLAAGRVDAWRPPVPAGSARAPRRSPLPASGAAVRSGPQAAPRGVKWGTPGTRLAATASSLALGPPRLGVFFSSLCRRMFARGPPDFRAI